MLILRVPNALQHTSPGGTAQALGGSLGVDVAEVDRPVHAIRAIRSSKVRGEGQ